MERGQGSEKKKKKVMVAIDESEVSRYALEWAVQYFHETLVNADLFILAAQPNVEYRDIFASASDVTTPELLNAVQDNQKKIAIGLLDKAKEFCRINGINATITTSPGDPKKIICQEVERLKIDVLIVGSHGRGALKRAFMGSVSEYCVNHAKCSVLVARKLNMT